MKFKLPILIAGVLMLFSAEAANGQAFPTPTPIPDIPISVTNIKIRKQRSFPAEVEIQTSLGKFTGTGTLQWGAIVCTSIDPCLSGTKINTGLKLSNVTGTLDGQNFRAGGGDLWIGYHDEWIIPYFNPYGRRVKNFQASFMTDNIAFSPIANPMINYLSTTDMIGTIKTEMSPLKRFQSPRPYSEFVGIEINLVPGSPPI